MLQSLSNNLFQIVCLDEIQLVLTINFVVTILLLFFFLNVMVCNINATNHLVMTCDDTGKLHYYETKAL